MTITNDKLGPVKFPLADVLAIITGRNLHDRYDGGVQFLIERMTGEDVMNISLVPAMLQCRPVLLRFYPELRDIDTEGIDEDWVQWLDKQIEKYGESLAVPGLCCELTHICEVNYCTSEAQIPKVDKDTFYSDYEPNGSKYAGVPQCHTCKRSNSYGKWGCPRMNARLPIREAIEVGDIPEVVLW